MIHDDHSNYEWTLKGNSIDIFFFLFSGAMKKFAFFLLNFFQRSASLRMNKLKSRKTTQDKRQGDLDNNILCGCEK